MRVLDFKEDARCALVGHLAVFPRNDTVPAKRHRLRVPPQNRPMGAYVTVGAAYFPGGGRLFYQRGVGSSGNLKSMV